MRELFCKDEFTIYDSPRGHPIYDCRVNRKSGAPRANRKSKIEVIMATLYVASTETFVGKSATCVGLLDRARRDGFTAGYMKPVSVSVVRTEDALLDEDAVFIRQHFGLTDPIDKIAPVLVT